MKIKGEVKEKIEVKDKELAAAEDGKIKKKKKEKVEAEGSRWAALILLLMTLAVGGWFYFQGAR